MKKGSEGYAVAGYLVMSLREAKAIAKREANADRRPIMVEDVATGKTVAMVYPSRGNPSRRRNPTRAARRLSAKKAATDRRVATALAKYLRAQNPGAKLAGAKVQKLKGGVLKITPVKMNRRRR